MREAKSCGRTGPLPSMRLPLYGYSLRDIIRALVNTVHDNTMAAIFTIGMVGLNFVFIPDYPVSLKIIKH